MSGQETSKTVSVIITSHTWGRYGLFKEAIRSIESQTYDDIELVLPLDGDPDMVETTELLTDGGAEITYDPETTGLSEARNRGASNASGEIYAFLDDDCVAAPEWIAELVAAFEDGAIAAGGPAIPEWPSERPPHIPREFDWLIGGGPYYAEESEIRNTYGCNIAFRADVFHKLGGFDPAHGKNGNMAQAEETELCVRMRERFGKGLQYRPNATVRHRVFPEQLELLHLLKRAYHQGVSKRQIGLGDEEGDFLSEVGRSLYRNQPLESIAALSYTASVGAGFLLGRREAT
jgi:GT2 family glycosyltransferase